MTRYCNHCDGSYDLEHFYANMSKGVLRYRCKIFTKNRTKQTTHAWKKRNPARIMLKSAKARAERHNVPFDLVYEDIRIPELCPLLEIPLFVANGSPGPNSPSLDRILPELGYVRGNVRVVSHLANTMKNSATPEQLRTFALNILKET